MNLRWLDRFPNLQVVVRLQGPIYTPWINTGKDMDQYLLYEVVAQKKYRNGDLPA